MHKNGSNRVIMLLHVVFFACLTFGKITNVANKDFLNISLQFYLFNNKARESIASTLRN